MAALRLPMLFDRLYERFWGSCIRIQYTTECAVYWASANKGRLNAEEMPYEMVVGNKRHYKDMIANIQNLARWNQLFNKASVGKIAMGTRHFPGSHIVCQWQEQQKEAVVAKHLPQIKNMDWFSIIFRKLTFITRQFDYMPLKAQMQLWPKEKSCGNENNMGGRNLSWWHLSDPHSV